MEIEQQDCSSKVDKLLEKYSWIATAKQLFGKSGTDYDFASCEPHKAREIFRLNNPGISDVSISSIIHYELSDIDSSASESLPSSIVEFYNFQHEHH